MRVLIASTIAPFVAGGATVIVDSLERALVDRGHDVDVLRLPFDSDVNVLLPQMLAMRLHHVEEVGDRLICVRPPSYLIRHPSKVVWFIHHHRGFYDMWNTEYAGVNDDPRGRALRCAVRSADDVGLSEAQAVFANSVVVRDRLSEFNQCPAEVLYPPLDRPERFRCEGFGDTIVYVSRVQHHKRQWLAIEALALTKTPVRLTLLGAADSPAEAAHIAALIAAHDVADRVVFRNEWVDEETKSAALAECLAVVYCPVEEDSYGYPSLEAHQSGKAVLTTSDAGGVLELVQHSVNGFVCDPTPQSLATRFDELYEDRALAERMGTAGLVRISEMNISWDHTVERLLS